MQELRHSLRIFSGCRKGIAFPHARLEARTYREVKVLSRQTLSGL
jgi:hypothetical protein